MSRPAIPSQLKREVLVEAGHRCAIPTCKEPTLDIAHIVPFSKVKGHTFENLIALCPTCHRRYHKGEIDRKSIKCYKANLSLLTSRYGDLERRVIQHFVDRPSAQVISLSGSLQILLSYLMRDEILADCNPDDPFGDPGVMYDNYRTYKLTKPGVVLVRKVRENQRIR